MGPTRIRVRVVGQGEPLLMIMGLGGHLNMWDALTPELPDRQLIMFDFPGTGWSGHSFLPPHMGSNALIVRRLLRTLGHSRVDVLGYSWGGLLAQHLAVQHPSSVRRLVLAATTPGLGGQPPALRTMARMMTPRRYYSADYYTRVAPTLYGGGQRVPAKSVDEDVRRRTTRPPSVLGYLSQLSAVTGYSTVPVLPLIKAPTLVLAGDDDPIVPVRNTLLLARLIPGATLRILPGEGHLLLLDSPSLSGAIVTSFLNGEDPPTGGSSEESRTRRA